MNVKRNATGLMPYTSVNENLFMRGAAATYAVARHVELTGFYSQKGLDANISSVPAGNDSLDTIEPEVVFSSFQEDGFHRTQREVDRKRSVDERIMGGHLRYSRPGLGIGATAAHVAYGADLVRDLREYNQFEFQGRSNTTMGIDWNALYRNLTFYGEAARSANGGTAWNSGLLMALDKRVSMSLVYRDYARDYQNLYSVAFGEGINPWNQRGLYTGVEIRANRRWTINAFMDRWRHQWLRYQVDAPSTGTDWMLQVNWRPQRGTELYARVRHRVRPRNTAEAVELIRPVVDMEQTNYRVNASYKVSPSVSLRTRVETHLPGHRAPARAQPRGTDPALRPVRNRQLRRAHLRLRERHDRRVLIARLLRPRHALVRHGARHPHAPRGPLGALRRLDLPGPRCDRQRAAGDLRQRAERCEGAAPVQVLRTKA
jgi:hypothetical protein